MKRGQNKSLFLIAFLGTFLFAGCDFSLPVFNQSVVKERFIGNTNILARYYPNKFRDIVISENKPEGHFIYGKDSLVEGESEFKLESEGMNLPNYKVEELYQETINKGRLID